MNLHHRMSWEHLPVSGVGSLTTVLGCDVERIEKHFPLPEKHPTKLHKALYPKLTDSLFMKAVYEAAEKPLSMKILSTSGAYCRMSELQRQMLLNYPCKHVFPLFEPDIEQYPGVIDTFMKTAARYANPIPSFEIDCNKYGAADLLHGTTLVEMKSYSVMTFTDLVNARNQVLTYACIGTVNNLFPVKLTHIEVVNSLTGEVWNWPIAEFFESGEGTKLYWTLIYPLIGNKVIFKKDEEANLYISRLKDLYNRDLPDVSLLAFLVYEKEQDQINNLRSELHRARTKLDEEISIRKNILKRFIPINKPKVEPDDEDDHWINMADLSTF